MFHRATERTGRGIYGQMTLFNRFNERVFFFERVDVRLREWTYLPTLPYLAA